MGNRYLDLAVVDAEATIEESQVALEGRIENIGSEAAERILLVTTFYDSQRNVTGFHELTLDFMLAPGEEQTFIFVAAPPGGQVVGYTFLVQGLVIDGD